MTGSDDGWTATGYPTSPALRFFLEDYPRFREMAVNGSASEVGMLECTQEAGDVLVVPRGWPHAVLNVKSSVAVTREFL